MSTMALFFSHRIVCQCTVQERCEHMSQTFSISKIATNISSCSLFRLDLSRRVCRNKTKSELIFFC